MSITEERQDSIRTMLETLSPGERMFATNHLWKHHKVAPQKLRKYIPEAEFLPPIKAGDFVQLDTGRFTVVNRVSSVDNLFEVFIPGTPGDTEWVGPKCIIGVHDSAKK